MRKKLPLHTKIIIGLLLGMVWAFASTHLGFSAFTIDYILPFGDIFISILKLIAIPLVLFSIISGITSLSDISSLGRISAKTMAIYLATTLFAICLGLLLVNTIKPGARIQEDQRIVNRMSYEMWLAQNPQVSPVDNLSFLNKPEYSKFLSEAATKMNADAANDYAQNGIAKAKNVTSNKPMQWLTDMVPSNLFTAFVESQMIQIIFFAIFFGLALALLQRKVVGTVVDFCSGASEVFIKMVDIVMLGAPYFVFALLAGKLAEMSGDQPGRLIEIFKALGYYSLVVVIGLLIMIFVVYPVMVSAVISKRTKMSFGQVYTYFMKGIRPAQLLAFSTSSSAATLPVTMDCVHTKLGVDEEVSNFVLPIGATVNMDGTSLYQAVAVLFLAQFHFIELSFTQQIVIILTTTLASIGSAAVPSAGLIMLIVVLESVGLNPIWIAIIFPVDRILDMCRTVVNVTGDAAVSVIVAQTENKLNVNTLAND